MPECIPPRGHGTGMAHVSLRGYVRRTQERLTRAELAWAGLRNSSSPYAREIALLVSTHRQVLMVYRQALADAEAMFGQQGGSHV